MIHLSKLVAAVSSANTVADLINNVVEARGYTYGDYVVSVKQPATPGTYAFTTGMPYHLGLNDARSDWPVYLLTGTFTIDNVKKNCLVFSNGYDYELYNVLSVSIEVAADDPLIGTGTTRTIHKGSVLAELLGYDQYMVVYHSDNIQGCMGEFPGFKWNPDARGEPLDPPVLEPRRFIIREATLSSDSEALPYPNLFDPRGHYSWTPSENQFGFRDQNSGSSLTQRLWFIPLQDYITDTENMTDLAMLRVTASVHALKAADTAVDENVTAAETAILALQHAFEETAVFGSKVGDVVDRTLAVRAATNYIPRP